MILRIKKELYKDENDFVIESGEFYATVVKFIKSYAIYNNQDEQICQIEFKELLAKVIVAESAAINIVRRGQSYIIDKAFIDDESITNPSTKKENKSKYFIYGKPLEYKYDIYEQTVGAKRPELAATVINDINDNQFYKIRISGGSNMLKLLAISLAIAKLNSDPESNY
ncbi:MAG: hypothetical protein ACOCWI_05185 [Bacillota bacterium]